MKSWKTLPLAVVGLTMTVVTTYLVVTTPDEYPPGPDTEAPQIADRLKSTGLFVGVSRFAHDTPEVPFAVDDAIDLAYRFSLDQRSSLVPPRQVVLALSGEPRKDDSKRRLKELVDAGASVENATSGDILQLLQKQVSHSGNNGLVILTLATHGFLDDDGYGYILGSTSKIGSPETSLATTRLLDIAGNATRSLVFIDACRNRAVPGRSGASDPKTVAPLLEKMKKLEGQVVYYAAASGQYANDDFVSQNGVFTKAVLDGLDCQASAPRGYVTAGTLNTYVERHVREWLKKNEKPNPGLATQFNQEGTARNMRLAECWLDPKFLIRAEFDGRQISAYDSSARPLFRNQLRAPIFDARGEDLDADAFYEVVAATADGITVFNREGDVVGENQGDGVSLAAFTTADLFRKHTKQIVTLWHDAETTTVTVLDSKGDEISHVEFLGRFVHVAVGRETNRHAPRIVIASANSVMVLTAKKLEPEWEKVLASPNDRIEGLSIVDDNTKNRSIAVQTRRGKTAFDFDGNIFSSSTAWKAVLE